MYLVVHTLVEFMYLVVHICTSGGSTQPPPCIFTRISDESPQVTQVFVVVFV